MGLILVLVTYNYLASSYIKQFLFQYKFKYFILIHLTVNFK